MNIKLRCPRSANSSAAPALGRGLSEQVRNQTSRRRHGKRSGRCKEKHLWKGIWPQAGPLPHSPKTVCPETSSPQLDVPGSSHTPDPLGSAHGWEGVPITEYKPATSAACTSVIHYFSTYYPQPLQAHIASTLRLHPSPQQLPRSHHQAGPGHIFGVMENLKSLCPGANSPHTPSRASPVMDQPSSWVCWC